MVTIGPGFDSKGTLGRWTGRLHLFCLGRKALSSVQQLLRQPFNSTLIFQLWNHTLFLLLSEVWFFMTLWIKFAVFSHRHRCCSNIPLQFVTHKLQDHFQKHNSGYDTPQLQTVISNLLPIQEVRSLTLDLFIPTVTTPDLGFFFLQPK